MSTPRNAELVLDAAGKVIDRLKSTPKNRGEDTQKLIVRFVLERFLARYAQVRK